jgi:hypothetical protein
LQQENAQAERIGEVTDSRRFDRTFKQIVFEYFHTIKSCSRNGGKFFRQGSWY